MAQKLATPGFRKILTTIGRQAGTTGKAPLGRFAEFVASINLSIRAKILIALCVVILLMGITNVVSMLQVLKYSRQYDAIITNITTRSEERRVGKECRL